jgi:hypothetical protein
MGSYVEEEIFTLKAQKVTLTDRVNFGREKL